MLSESKRSKENGSGDLMASSSSSPTSSSLLRGEPSSKVEDITLLGASCLPSTSTSAAAVFGSSVDDGDGVDEEDLRELQLQKDEEFARKVQTEMEQCEKDQQLAIEAQDRELAKMLFEKEKARLKRAKERARLKAAAETQEEPPHHPHPLETPVANSDYELNRVPPPSIPPMIPEKSATNVQSNDCFIGFKACPKKLPPNPHSHSPLHSIPAPYHRHTQQQQQSSSAGTSSSSNGSAHTHPKESHEPIPPYMPLHGFNLNGITKQRPGYDY